MNFELANSGQVRVETLVIERVCAIQYCYL